MLLIEIQVREFEGIFDTGAEVSVIAINMATLLGIAGYTVQSRHILSLVSVHKSASLLKCIGPESQ